MTVKSQLEKMQRSSITITIADQAPYKSDGSHFGGQPDVPPDFIWPVFTGTNAKGTKQTRPLAFLAQFNCAELAVYDTEHLLPQQGLLSFFYELDSMTWGFDPKDKGSARVFWFEDITSLSQANFPANMKDDFKLPSMGIIMQRQNSYPDWEDFTETYPQTNDEEFDAALEALGVQETDERSQLLGWPDLIQGSMAEECELVTKNFYLGKGFLGIPKDVRRQAKQVSLERWRLLFQLDTVENDDFCLMFGDCGRIYFFIPKEDLLARRFDNVWLMLQCY